MDVDLNKITQSNYLLQLGINQYVGGGFLDAIKNLKKASSHFLKEEHYEKYLQCQNLLIIMYVEMENFSAVQHIRHELSEIIWNRKSLGANYARFHFVLGFCFLRQDEFIKAQIQFDQALAQNLQLQKQSIEEKDQKKTLISQINMCYISYGFVSFYICNGQIPEAIQELKNMEMLIEHFKALYAELNTKEINFTQKSNEDMPEFLEHLRDEQQTLEFTGCILKAHILTIEKKYDSAEELYWICYEQSQKNYRRKYMSLHLLYFLGRNYMAKEDYEQASIFLNLAKKSANPNFLKKMDRKITQALEKLKETMANNYDIIVNFENNMIVEKQKGRINIKNQFVLLDMLKLFISDQGAVYSKEFLVEKVWKQKYDPTVHDNKIYVTIKRLRELIEPDHRNPKYIFRTKEGYYINKSAKILLK